MSQGNTFALKAVFSQHLQFKHGAKKYDSQVTFVSSGKQFLVLPSIKDDISRFILNNGQAVKQIEHLLIRGSLILIT